MLVISLAILLRLLYASFFVVMFLWFTYDALNWFRYEKHANNTEVVSFNWHPLFMSFAVLVCMSEALVAFSFLRNTVGVTHQVSKTWHAGCQGTAVCLMAAGLAIIFTNHHEKGIKHMYSAHSWLGIGVAAFMVLQATQGAVVYLYGLNHRIRAAMLPFHKYIGLVIYFLACTVICMGIQEKESFLKATPNCKDHSYCDELQLGNVLAVLVVAIAATTGSLVYMPTAPVVTGDEEISRSLLS